jgi:hypothetical protein
LRRAKPGHPAPARLPRSDNDDIPQRPAALAVRPDLVPVRGAETEPDPIPVPTIAWITWHLGWWWSVTLDHLRARAPRDRTDVTWPGDAASTVTWLRRLHTEWIEVLDALTDDDLDTQATFPWQGDPTMTVAHTLAWANTELAKNASEIGQLRLVRAAG